MIDPSFKDFDNNRRFNADLVATGSEIGGQPIANILVKKRQYTWDAFLSSGLYTIANLLIPESQKPLIVMVQPKDVPEWKIPQATATIYGCGFTDTEIMQVLGNAQALYAPYLDSMTLDLANMKSIPLHQGIPIDATRSMIQLMFYNLNRVPLQERSTLAKLLYQFTPAQPKEVYDYFRTTFAPWLGGNIAVPSASARVLPKEISDKWGFPKDDATGRAPVNVPPLTIDLPQGDYFWLIEDLTPLDLEGGEEEMIPLNNSDL